MKTSSCLLGLIGLGWIIYCFFQPFFDGMFGWAIVPDQVYQEKFEGKEAKEYLSEIESSKRRINSIQLASQAPSISIAVMINGEMVWTYAVGFQDISNKIPADTSSQYRIGSVSKALTSLGLGRMIQNGEIHPDSSLQYYTDKFLDKPAITIRQLASHQSGIRNYGVCLCFPIWEYYRNKQFDSIEESLKDFESEGLLFSPGEDFSYSSYNFTALSLAMEKASSKSYPQFMRKDVFELLGMNNTELGLKANQRHHRAIPYETQRKLYKRTPQVNLSNKWAGGGFVSTPSDLVRAGNALLDSFFINKQTIDIITAPQRLKNDSINEQNYALGWRHNLSKRYFEGKRKVDVIHHGGMAVGGLALLAVYPEYDMVISIALNKSGEQGRFELFNYVSPIANAFLKSIEEKQLLHLPSLNE